jgi:hypothetical protein
VALAAASCGSSGATVDPTDTLPPADAGGAQAGAVGPVGGGAGAPGAGAQPKKSVPGWPPDSCKALVSYLVAVMYADAWVANPPVKPDVAKVLGARAGELRAKQPGVAGDLKAIDDEITVALSNVAAGQDPPARSAASQAAREKLRDERFSGCHDVPDASKLPKKGQQPPADPEGATSTTTAAPAPR